MKKLLLFTLIAFAVSGCEDKDKELTFEEKRIKSEESAKKYMSKTLIDWTKDYTYHFEDFKVEYKSLDYLKYVLHIGDMPSQAREHIEKNFTKTNYSIKAMAEEDKLYSLIFFLNDEFVVLTCS